MAELYFQFYFHWFEQQHCHASLWQGYFAQDSMAKNKVFYLRMPAVSNIFAEGISNALVSRLREALFPPKYHKIYLTQDHLELETVLKVGSLAPAN